MRLSIESEVTDMGCCLLKVASLLLVTPAPAAIIVAAVSTPDHLLLGSLLTVVLSILAVESALHFVQAFWNVLPSLLQKLNKWSYIVFILSLADKAVGDSLGSSSTGSSNPMDIIVESALHWHVVVDHNSDILHV